jgi:glutathione S-transferase
VLRDETTGRTIPESSVIIEYLDRHHPGKTRFIPADPELAWQVRLKDRFYDLHLHLHMQKVVGDRMRPEGRRRTRMASRTRARMTVALDMIDAEMAGRTRDGRRIHHGRLRVAAPPLFYIDKVFRSPARTRTRRAYLQPSGAPPMRTHDRRGEALFLHVPQVIES